MGGEGERTAFVSDMEQASRGRWTRGWRLNNDASRLGSEPVRMRIGTQY